MSKLHYLALGFALILGATPARPADREFHEIVARLSDAYHTKPVHFMGLVSLAMRVAHPEGVGGIRMAIFDDIDPCLGSGAPDLNGFLKRTVGPAFQPFVRVRSNRDKDQTYIYAREAKGGWEMLLVTVEPREAVVMKIRLSGEAMRRWVDDPVDQGRGSAHHTDSGNLDWND